MIKAAKGYSMVTLLEEDNITDSGIIVGKHDRGGMALKGTLGDVTVYFLRGSVMVEEGLYAVKDEDIIAVVN